MKVLHAVASLHASYGGPARSVPALARALREQGCETTVWAPDGSGEGDGSMEGYDLIHDHGIWLPHNWRLAKEARRRGTPRIVSPRGMLEPWALRHKRWKKRVAWWLYQERDLISAELLHATSEAEFRSIRRLFPKARICTIPNGVDLPAAVPAKSPPADGRRRILFLGRIYPVKGLPMLVEAWHMVRPPGWCIEIAGPDEDGHRREVEAAVHRFGVQNDFVFSGPIDGAQKTEAFARAELLVLPSFSENFGMAAAEALAHGVPVLTTTGTPWNMLVSEGCGWQVGPECRELADGLRQATVLSTERLAEMGRRGRTMVGSRFSWSVVAAALMEEYNFIRLSRMRSSGG